MIKKPWTCTDCGEVFDPSNDKPLPIWQEGLKYCAPCYEDIPRCGVCDGVCIEPTILNSSNRFFHKKGLCDNCLKREAVYCDYCSEWWSDNDTYSTPYLTSYDNLCHECIDIDFNKCSSCEDIFENHNIYITPEGEEWCDSCFFEDFFLCSNCGESAYIEYYNHGFCNDCYYKNSGYISNRFKSIEKVKRLPSVMQISHKTLSFIEDFYGDLNNYGGPNIIGIVNADKCNGWQEGNIKSLSKNYNNLAESLENLYYQNKLPKIVEFFKHHIPALSDPFKYDPSNRTRSLMRFLIENKKLPDGSKLPKKLYKLLKGIPNFQGCRADYDKSLANYLKNTDADWRKPRNCGDFCKERGIGEKMCFAYEKALDEGKKWNSPVCYPITAIQKEIKLAYDNIEKYACNTALITFDIKFGFDPEILKEYEDLNYNVGSCQNRGDINCHSYGFASLLTNNIRILFLERAGKKVGRMVVREMYLNGEEGPTGWVLDRLYLINKYTFAQNDIYIAATKWLLQHSEKPIFFSNTSKSEWVGDNPVLKSPLEYKYLGVVKKYSPWFWGWSSKPAPEDTEFPHYYSDSGAKYQESWLEIGGVSYIVARDTWDIEMYEIKLMEEN